MDDVNAKQFWLILAFMGKLCVKDLYDSTYRESAETLQWCSTQHSVLRPHEITFCSIYRNLRCHVYIQSSVDT